MLGFGLVWLRLSYESEVLDKFDLESSHFDDVVFGRDLSLSIKSALSSELTDVLQLHDSLLSIKFDDCAFVAHLRLGYEPDFLARVRVGALCALHF